MNNTYRLFRADGQKFYLTAKNEMDVIELCMKIFGFKPVQIQIVRRRLQDDQ